MFEHVIGRDAELAVLEHFLDRVPQGLVSALLEGEAGAGKTTLWRAAVDRAERRHFQILQTQPGQSETTLSFSGISDLLGASLEAVLEELPSPQRRALRVALLLEDAAGSPPDQRAVGAAVLGTLKAISRAGPLVVAVDDVQWLDDASTAALLFAVRRLRGEPVGLVLALRVPERSVLTAELRRMAPPGRLEEITVGPLEVANLHRVVQLHLGIALPRPLLLEVHEAAGGNPFYALEIVRMLHRTKLSVEAGQRLPVPDSLRELVRGRLGALPPSCTTSRSRASSRRNAGELSRRAQQRCGLSSGCARPADVRPSSSRQRRSATSSSRSGLWVLPSRG